jgi:hypothetical protein
VGELALQSESRADSECDSDRKHEISESR